MPGQARGGIEQQVQLASAWQFAFFAGDRPSDLLQLLAVGQLVLNDDKQFLQLDRNRDNRREDDHKRAGLLARAQLGQECLHNLR
jgi:hypothetical protein